MKSKINGNPNRNKARTSTRNKEQTSTRFAFPYSEPQHEIPTLTRKRQQNENSSDKPGSKPKFSVKFSDKPLKINKELSQKEDLKRNDQNFQAKEHAGLLVLVDRILRSLREWIG